MQQYWLLVTTLTTRWLPDINLVWWSDISYPGGQTLAVSWRTNCQCQRSLDCMDCWSLCLITGPDLARVRGPTPDHHIRPLITLREGAGGGGGAAGEERDRRTDGSNNWTAAHYWPGALATTTPSVVLWPQPRWDFWIKYYPEWPGPQNRGENRGVCRWWSGTLYMERISVWVRTGVWPAGERVSVSPWSSVTVPWSWGRRCGWDCCQWARRAGEEDWGWVWVESILHTGQHPVCPDIFVLTWPAEAESGPELCQRNTSGLATLSSSVSSPVAT